MVEQDSELDTQFRRAAIETIQSCARDIISVDALMEQMRQLWIQLEQQGAQLTPELVQRMALRCCSQALYWAWQSSDPYQRDRASAVLMSYLERSLRRTGYAAMLHAADYDLDEILQETLLDMQRGYRGELVAGPTDPGSFLKWSQTILIRHARQFVQKVQRDRARYASLEEEAETLWEQPADQQRFVDQSNLDPLEMLLIVELQQALNGVILSLRNQHYQEVLLCTYLVGLDEQEMSQRWEVPIQKIYLWRHRALDALRKNPDLMGKLRALRE
jgi:DNA-directed RNA polymerase specialized sigma24 family protein